MKGPSKLHELRTGLALSFLLAACQGEGFVDKQLHLNIINERNESIYFVRGLASDSAEEAFTKWAFVSVPPSQSAMALMGAIPRDGNRRGGCFENEQLWVLRSLSDTRYGEPNNPSSDQLDDLHILLHFDQNTCFVTNDIDIVVD